jgi:hypothetical protein
MAIFGYLKLTERSTDGYGALLDFNCVLNIFVH